MTTSEHHHPLVNLIEETDEWALGDLFRVTRATLQHRRFDERMSDPITRINFERGDSVGVLLHEPQQDAVILVRQFRYPVYASLDAAGRDGEGAQKAWILELVAGMVEKDYTVGQVARKELIEEAGYQVRGELEPIATIYPSPGGTSERIHLFLGAVEGGDQTTKGGGVAAEGEDIQIVALPLGEAMDMVARGQIQDAKTIVALQHLALRRVTARDPTVD